MRAVKLVALVMARAAEHAGGYLLVTTPAGTPSQTVDPGSGELGVHVLVCGIGGHMPHFGSPAGRASSGRANC